MGILEKINFNLYKEKVIRHEIGHWLSARELGFEVGDINLNILENQVGFGHEGSATIKPCHNIEGIEDLKIYVENRIAILLSGVLSQVMSEDETEVNSSMVEELLDSDGADDNSKIIELSHILRGSIYKGDMNSDNEIEQLAEIMEICWKKSCDVLSKKKELIDYLLNQISIEITSTNKEYTFNNSKIEEWIGLFEP